jgi:hypothetical protein
MNTVTGTTLYTDTLFAPIDADLHLARIAGGNETEVYCTDDRRHVVKVKSEAGHDNAEDALAEARMLQQAARTFVEAIGEEHAIPTFTYIARDNQGRIKPVAVQPYLCNAHPLADVDYAALRPEARQVIAKRLREIILRSLDFYRRTGEMPDLYGRISRSEEERKRLNTPQMLPRRLWSFLIKRNLLRSQNLLLCQEQESEPRILLVDYDPVQKSTFYRFLYYTVRCLLFLRDLVLIRLMETGIYPWKTERVLHQPSLGNRLG